MRSGQILIRLFGLVAGVYLAGLPTYYALFTVGDTGAAASGARSSGIPLFVVWVLVALVAGYLALLKDSELMRILRPARRRFRSARQNDAVTNLVKLLLNDRRFGKLRAFDPKVFVCDDRSRPSELLPFGEDAPADWQRWRVGYGAVGAAFEANRDDVLVFTGDALTDQNKTLTEEQLRRFGSLGLVAAVVVRGQDERPIGALGLSSSDDSGFGPSRIDAMRLLASEIGILVDLVV